MAFKPKFNIQNKSNLHRMHLKNKYFKEFIIIAEEGNIS